MFSLILALAIGQTVPVARPREGRHPHHGPVLIVLPIAPPLPLAPAAPLPLASPVVCGQVCVSHATFIVPRGAGRGRRHGCRLVRGLVRRVFSCLELCK